uniref:Uncharacterized protein n=1 Tax=Hyaloperonospora arabidopsidis (strain Emoy2) TaxID=559515 RepID=M4C5N2_HYAAE
MFVNITIRGNIQNTHRLADMTSGVTAGYSQNGPQNRPLTKSGVRFLSALYRTAVLLSCSEKVDSGDRGRFTRSPCTTAVVPPSHLAHQLVVDFVALQVGSGSQRAQMCPDAPLDEEYQAR